MNKPTTSKPAASKPTSIRPLDSYQKFANDVFSGKDDVFKHVNPAERADLRVQFARLVAEADRPHNLCVYPLHMSPQFRLAQGEGQGHIYTSQIRMIESGRIYWVGFNYGVDVVVADARIAA